MSPNPETIRLSGSCFEVLREVIEKRAPELLSVLREAPEIVVAAEQKRVLAELVGDEFCATGLRADDEPNERGLALEALIDALSPWK